MVVIVGKWQRNHSVAKIRERRHTLINNTLSLITPL